jgi:hypothetical protein
MIFCCKLINFIDGKVCIHANVSITGLKKYLFITKALMKKNFALITFLLSFKQLAKAFFILIQKILLFHLAGYNQWQQTSGPGGGFSRGLYAKDNALFTGNFEHFSFLPLALPGIHFVKEQIMANDGIQKAQVYVSKFSGGGDVHNHS